MIDYLVNATGDLQIANGDFVKGDSTQQNQDALLIAMPGEYKQFPTAGVGLISYLNDDSQSSELLRQIRLQFTQDGMTVNQLNIVNGVIQADASYVNG